MTLTKSYGLDGADKPDDAYDPNLKGLQNIVRKTSEVMRSPRGRLAPTGHCWHPGANVVRDRVDIVKRQYVVLS